MREFNALAAYPKAGLPRIANRNIQNRIAASYRDHEFFDGDRSNGYGGLSDDGRWRVIAARMAAEYGLMSESSAVGLGATARVLQIGCEKGFLLAEFRRLGVAVRGTETSRYAIANAAVPVYWSPPIALPFDREDFDFVIALGTVYTLNLADAMTCLREIERVGKGRSFITLAAYETIEDLQLMMRWSLLGATILRRDEWLTVLQHVGYRGDYSFVTAESLNLVAAPRPAPAVPQPEPAWT